MKTIAIALTLSLALSITALCQAAESGGPVVVKKADLPALKGGSSKAERKTADDGIPTCFGGNRAKVSATTDAVKEWATTHADHVCANASTVYVCRAGRKLSVRCE
jgi:hypothetical protein